MKSSLALWLGEEQMGFVQWPAFVKGAVSTLLICNSFVFETGFLCVDLAVLERPLKTRLTSDLDLLTHFLSAGIKGMRHHRQRH